jgi:hypothetical protein
LLTATIKNQVSQFLIRGKCREQGMRGQATTHTHQGCCFVIVKWPEVIGAALGIYKKVPLQGFRKQITTTLAISYL